MEELREKFRRRWYYRSISYLVKPSQLGKKVGVVVEGRIPGFIEYGGENAKVCFVNSEENGLAVAENMYWGVMRDKVGKCLILFGLS